MPEIASLGTVGRDADLKVSKNGNAYLRFSIREGAGEQAQWFTVMYFAADAADLVTKVKQGARCFVEGSLRLDSWEGKDGQKRTGLTVMASYLRIAEIGRNKPKRPQAEATAKASQPNNFHSDPLPW